MTHFPVELDQVRVLCEPHSLFHGLKHVLGVVETSGEWYLTQHCPMQVADCTLIVRS